MKCVILLFFILLISFNLNSLETQLEIDPYYTSYGAYINLTDKGIKHLGKKSEFEIYSYLLKNLYKPRELVIETSFNPMPYAGTVIKRSYKKFYKKAQLTSNLNYISAITAGFEEPWAFSIFLGNVVEFDSIKKKIFGKRKGYSGILFDFGDYHIRNNELVYDKWMQSEIKLKGEQIIEKRNLIWSYRIGIKLHENKNINDSFYIGIKRSRTDFKPKGKWYENTEIELTSSFNLKTYEPIRYYFLIGKKFPLKNKRMAISFSLGFVWDSNKKYQDYYSNQNTFSFLIRPNIEF